MTIHLTTIIALVALAAAPDTGEQDALITIESTRGGRHWVDAATAAPKSPAESLACFEIEPGVRIELVAAEPLVMDPVAIAFDAAGQMFVAEYGDYPVGPEDANAPPLSRIVMLTDSDGDGQLDRRHMFADELSFAHSLMPYRDGLIVATDAQLLHLRDTDGDHRADVRKVLFDGFIAAHAQIHVGCPRWGLDNWVYLNYGPGTVTSAAAPDEPVSLPALDFRFDPRTLQFGSDSGAGQYGNTFDNWGQRFFSTNRNPIITTALPFAATRRNPYVVIPNANYDVAPSGGASRVYPLVEMKSNYLSHAGTHTAACGTTAYRGDLLGDEYAQSVFTCEPVGNLVTRAIVRPDGVTFTSDRARENADFLASTDTWFRPASLATGPDGALYLADMYRLWVEHPRFLPEGIAAQLDWRAGEDRGRIYRIVPDEHIATDKRVAPQSGSLRPYAPPESTTDCVALLSDSNGWRRQLGQRLLVERQDEGAVVALRVLLTESDDALARLHALWTLEGMSALTTADLLVAIDDADVHVRRDAVKLSGRFFANSEELFERVIDRADDEDVRVRFEVALALGELDSADAARVARRAEVLTRFAAQDGNERWFALAILTSAKDCAGSILAGLVDEDDFAANGDAARVELLTQLATIVGARGDLQELAALLSLVTAPTTASPATASTWWQNASLAGLAMGLPRHRGGLGETSLPALLAAPPEELAVAATAARQLLAHTADVATDASLAAGQRTAAVRLLAYQPFAAAVGAFEDLLTTGQPLEVQLATIDSMQSGGTAAAEIILDRWPTLGPKARGAAQLLLLRRTDTTRQLLAAMADQRVSPSTIGIDDRVRLLRHGDAEIKQLATALFGGAISSNRREVAERYASALTLDAAPVAGAKVFARTCAKCHRIDGHGQDVGPDISDVRNRSPEALLYDILDPNLKVEPNYSDYTIVTDDGRVLNGLMIAETADAVVLRQAEGNQLVIPRGEIEQIATSGQSLMPEGVEQDITVQQMADLLTFLKATPRPPITE